MKKFSIDDALNFIKGQNYTVNKTHILAVEDDNASAYVSGEFEHIGPRNPLDELSVKFLESLGFEHAVGFYKSTAHYDPKFIADQVMVYTNIGDGYILIVYMAGDHHAIMLVDKIDVLSSGVICIGDSKAVKYFSTREDFEHYIMDN